MSTIPSFGVGTFRLAGQTVIDSVRNALIAALERNGREVNPEGLAPVWN